MDPNQIPGTYTDITALERFESYDNEVLYDCTLGSIL